MKKTLLLSLLAIGFNSFGQVLESENFNSLPIGDIGTDITGATPGLSNWLTFSSNGTAPTTSTNANNSNYQVVANGKSTTNGLQITSPNGDKGNRFMWKDGLATSWNSRTASNDIIEIEYDFFTGPITDSRTQIGMRIFGLDGTNTSQTLNGFVYNTNTRVLSGVAYLNNGGTIDTFLINLAAGGLVLDPDTWYSVGCSYNTVTGELLWKTSPTAPTSGIANSVWIPNLSPNEVDFVQFVVAEDATETPPIPANTVISSILFDNYVARASATDTLLSNDDFNSSSANISIYPNPVNDVLNISSPDFELQSITVTDINGRIVKDNKANNTNVEMNVSDLNSGVYFINVKTIDGSVVKKFIKN
ncbi:T9SS type A sorting domain-containing protein [Flavobacterium sp.]|uniref:T9SS type A sorting domain-containing protein n=1 Tax=Flavobacterium sp. TaxID=239 RepID=UPI00404754EB